MLGELSKKHFQKEDLQVRFKKEIRRLAIEIVRFREFKISRDKEKRKALKKIQLIGAIDKKEYDSFQKLNLLKPNSKYIRFTYYPLEYIFDGKLNTKISGNNIMIGNSATVTNNHLEVFNKLKKLDIGTRKLIVPLSYGSNNYANVIIKEGQQNFDKNFTALRDFMPLDQYQKIIGSCNILIMNHYRQQGVGNILSMLWMGAKVFLSEKSILFKIFQEMGCAIFSVENDLESNNLDCLTPLSNETIDQNRASLFKHFSLDIVAKNLREDIIRSL